MVGQGVLRECLLDPDVSSVLIVGRRPSGQQHAKLRELVVPDLADLTSIQLELTGLDACFFCLGASSAGLSEAEYTKVTYDLTLAIGRTLAPLNPGLTFIYVSGAGTDNTERGRVMWARVKGRTENALLRLPFKAAYMLRPGIIQPLHGITSRTGWYRGLYVIARPLFPVVRALSPNSITTTERVGRAMLAVARRGFFKPVLEMPDINKLSAP